MNIEPLELSTILLERIFNDDDDDLDDDDDDDGDDDDGDDGVHPNSHKHFIPYMGFCASIWDSVRHHCHHHHHQK